MLNAASYNPINTTLRMPGSRSVTAIGVQAYRDWDQGIEATAKTLAQNNMNAITASLARSAPADDTLRAVASSPWGCTICGNTPAASLQYYANKVFPLGGGGGWIDTGESALKELFHPRPAVKYGLIAFVGVMSLTGIATAAYGITKHREA